MSTSPPVARVRRLGEHVGRIVRVQGWLANRRSSGKLQFLQVRDGSGTVQGILPKGVVPDEVFKRLDALPVESSLEIEGKVVAEARAPGGHELHVSSVR